MVDLFAGLGGFSAAARQVGIDCLYATDWDSACAATYQANFPTRFVCQDIRQPQVIDDLKKLNFELLTAGFPCQSFSRAGGQRGLADERGQLFFALWRVIAACQPPIILLENVAALVSHHHGQTWGQMLATLASGGYHVQFARLNARQISGLPQNRLRLYLVGWRDPTPAALFSFPPTSENFLPLSSVLEEKVADRYYLGDSPVARRIKAHSLQPGHLYTWRRSYLREATSGICPTLMASMGRGGFNVPLVVDQRGVRQLTVRECARLQGLPESFRFPNNCRESEIYYQIGNSISVPTVAAIMRQILTGWPHSPTEPTSPHELAKLR